MKREWSSGIKTIEKKDRLDGEKKAEVYQLNRECGVKRVVGVKGQLSTGIQAPAMMEQTSRRPSIPTINVAAATTE